VKRPVILPKFRDLLHPVKLRHGTDGFTSPPKEGALKMFFVLKIRGLRSGCEPANLGTKGQHDTSRPSKPLVNSLSSSARLRSFDW